MFSVGKRILLVDDEPLILKGLKYTLEQEGYETESAMDGEEALAMFESGCPSLTASLYASGSGSTATYRSSC